MNQASAPTWSWPPTLAVLAGRPVQQLQQPPAPGGQLGGSSHSSCSLHTGGSRGEKKHCSKFLVSTIYHRNWTILFVAYVHCTLYIHYTYLILKLTGVWPGWPCLQCFGSRSVQGPYLITCLIRICIQNTDPDPDA